MKATLNRELVLGALLAAVWRRRPATEVLVHSDQGSQYSSDDFRRFCQAHGPVPSISRIGNCWDDAVMESFFSSLKKEHIRKRIYKTRSLARADVFDYIEVFYNRSRRHSHLGGISPEAFERAGREAGNCLLQRRQSRGSPKVSREAGVMHLPRLFLDQPKI